MIAGIRVRRLRRILLAGVILSSLLLGLDLIIATVLPRQKSPTVTLRYLYEADSVCGYRLAPNWHGYFDDGVVRAEIQTNSYGDRDEEPRESDRQELLLIGDSFTFGFLLDTSQTIDRKIEDLSGGTVRAYNLGVPGYGPPAILESLRRHDRFSGSHVIYLFFNNDLRSDNLLPDMGLTISDGFMVPRYGPDGTPYNPEDYSRIIKRILASPTRQAVDSILHLRNLRAVLHLLDLREKFRRLRDPERALLAHFGSSSFSKENVRIAARLTCQMRDLATQRNQAFQVVVIPTVGEVRAGRLADLNEDYVRTVREEDIPILVPLSLLTTDDYYQHNLHFNPSGAEKIATTILSSIERIGGPE